MVYRHLRTLGAIALAQSTDTTESTTAGSTAGSTTEASCYFPSDIVFLQDTTGSFMDDMVKVVAQIPVMVAAIEEAFPGTRFGVAEFRDKPYFPLGETTDFCYKLRYGELSESPEQLIWAYSILQPSGGGDFYEAHYQAAIDVMSDAQIGWRPLVEGAYSLSSSTATAATAASEAVESRFNSTILHANAARRMLIAGDGSEYASAAAHIVILVTDAEPHVPGDMKMCAEGAAGWDSTWYCPQDLPANPGTVVDGNFTAMCSDYDYPSQDQFVNMALEQNFLFAFLTTTDVAPYYKKLLGRLGLPDSFHQVIENHSGNISDAVIQLLQDISDVACPDTTTEATTEATTTVLTETTVTAAAETTIASDTTVPSDTSTAPQTATSATVPTDSPVTTSVATDATVVTTPAVTTPAATDATVVTTPAVTTPAATDATVVTTPAVTTPATTDATVVTTPAVTTPATTDATAVTTPAATDATAVTTPAVTATATTQDSGTTATATDVITTTAVTTGVTETTATIKTGTTSTNVITTNTATDTTAANGSGSSETTSEYECPAECPPGDECCPEVVIKVGEKMKKLHFEFSN